jgi:hypothetical protein
MASKLLLLIMSLFVLFNFPLVGSVETSAVVWSRTYGGVDSDRVNTIIQAIDGGYALAGATQSFDNSSNQIWLIKTDSLGNMQWNKTYGTGLASSLVQTSDGGYIIGGYNSEGARLIKTNAEGNIEWTKNYGGGESVYTMVQTSDGGYAMAGSTDFDAAYTTDFWFAKTDAVGNLLWNRTYIRGGTTEWVNSVIQTSDRGYALIGVSTLGGGMTQWKLIKTDSAGNQEWSKGYGSIDKDEGHAVIQTSDGGYVLGGWMWTRSNGGGPIFALVKTDSAGNMQWNKTYGGGTAWSMVQTSDGGYALAGAVKLVKTDSEGNMQWSQIYSRHDTLKSVIQTNDGGYALVGTSIVLVDNVPTDNDAWFIKTAPDGTIPEFPSWIPLLIMLFSFTVIAVIYRHTLHKANHRRRLK